MKTIVTTTLLISVLSFSFAATINIPADIATIQAGIDSASAGDTVLVSPGTYSENLNYYGKDVVLLSTKGPDSTTIDGSAKGPVVIMSSGESNAAELNGFTIQNGSGTPSLTTPDAYFAGGVCVRYDSSPTLRNLIVQNNTVAGNGSNGGGIGLSTGSESLVEDVVIRNNTAFYGGGIYIYFSSPTLKNVVIHDNHALSSGGAAGIQTSTASLIGVLAYDNTAVEYAGGFWLYDKAKVTIDRTTMYGNSTSGFNGGGMWLLGGNTLYVINSILWDNAPNQIGSFVSGTYAANSIRIMYSDIEGGRFSLALTSGELKSYVNLTSQDPGCVDPINKDFSLTTTSTCIDAGIAFYAVESDTLVDLAPGEYFGSAPDLGAFESNYIPTHVDIETLIPKKLALHQNYPNPFNPSTRISWTLISPSPVQLDIFTIQGNHITTLVHEDQGPGTHQVEWDALNVAGQVVESGLYICRLTAGNKVVSKTMLLLH